MKKKVITHKVGWQIITGWFITPRTIFSHAICNNLSGIKMSPLWHKVTCKKCLKMRKNAKK